MQVRVFRKTAERAMVTSRIVKTVQELFDSERRLKGSVAKWPMHSILNRGIASSSLAGLTISNLGGGFESLRAHYVCGPVAQAGREQATHNRKVARSNRARTTCAGSSSG